MFVVLGESRRPARWLFALGALAAAAALFGAATASAASSGSRIVYFRDRLLHFLAPDGTPVGTSRFTEEFLSPVDMAASRNGRRVAILEEAGTRGALGDFYAIEVRTAGQRGPEKLRLPGPVETAGYQPSLALSPDGQMIALSLRDNIEIIDLRTGDRRWLRKAPGRYGSDLQPSFTADGRHLVFCNTDENRDADIYEIALRGGKARRLTETPEDEFFPELSPDGSHLTFLRRAGYHEFDVVIATAEDTGERVVGRIGYALGGPHFSPDGRSIVFTASKRSQGETPNNLKILTAAVSGGRAKQILQVRTGPPLPQWVVGP